jgi:hypothetical protein
MDKEPRPEREDAEPISLSHYRDKIKSKGIEKTLVYGSIQDTVSLLKAGDVKAEDLERKKTLSKIELYLLSEMAWLLERIQLKQFDLKGYKTTNEQLRKDFQAQKTRIHQLMEENERLKKELDIFHQK